MNELKPIIAKNISELRISFGMTQIELAEKLNYSDKAISKWERAESVPDISVLKKISEIFGVSIDYLVESEHKKKDSESSFEKDPSQEAECSEACKSRKKKNRGFITGMSILLVWLVATLIFIILDICAINHLRYLAFVYAVPASIIVWLIFNSIWFNPRRNFFIISILTWTVIAAIYVSLLLCNQNLWQFFFLGIPGQIIIYMWSRIRT